MSHQFRLRIFTYAIYSVLLTGIVIESYALVKQVGFLKHRSVLRSYKVNLEGNVRKPGWYAVPEGTTPFEILKVAGVRLTSDLTSMNLSSQLSNNQSIKVGTLEKPVAMSNESPFARLEFFFGELSLTDLQSKSITPQEGQNIASGDKLQTVGSCQAELSVGAFSRIDIDNFSEVTFDKINMKQSGKSITEISQKSGSCWYRIVYTNSDELYRIYTRSAVISIGGSGADFLLATQNDQIVINVMDGLVLAERRAGGEASNIISGQSVTIYDDGRPFQITRLAPDISASEQFSQLTKDKVSVLSRKTPMNFLFCVTPGIYYLIDLNFPKGEIHLIRIPADLLIKQFSQDISTIDEAYLYGGAVFVSTFLERIFNTRIQKYISCTRDDIVRIAAIFGGVNVDVDAKAAAFLGINRGKQKINGKIIGKYLSPAISGFQDANDRQAQMIRNLYEEFRVKNIVPTMMSADQVINSSETNFTAFEIVDQYAKYNEQTNWNYQEDILPVNMVKKEGKNYCDPILDDCRKIISTEQ